MKAGSYIQVSDNSGVSVLRIIKVLRRPAMNEAYVGDIVIGAAHKLNQRRKFSIKKGQLFRCIVLRTGRQVRMSDGRKLRFNRASVALVSRRNKPKATKIYGPVPIRLRELGFVDIISASTIAI